ncbi:MAG: hypothetical protein HC908_11540 [Calothrix sp. SM1_7_51]|nr:hypothetical protein [Calothrix sp. SM1_7_51]
MVPAKFPFSQNLHLDFIDAPASVEVEFWVFADWKLDRYHIEIDPDQIYQPEKLLATQM